METSDHGMDMTGNLQSHVVRCSAFPLPSVHSLCAPSAFLDRYRLFLFVSLPVQSHLSSSY